MLSTLLTVIALCPGAAQMPNEANIPLIRSATLCLINRERKVYRKHLLRENLRLEWAAQKQSLKIVSEGCCCADSRDLAQSVFEVNYIYLGELWMIGENIACSTLSLATPAAIVSGWLSSTTHRANILGPDFRDSGIGVVPAVPTQLADGQLGATYTQDFGVRIHG